MIVCVAFEVAENVRQEIEKLREELSNEDSVGDGSQLLRVGVLTHPRDTFDDDVLE